jgi:hypothetical protein
VSRPRESGRFKATHGGSAGGKTTLEYRVWCGLIARCTNPKEPSYDRYGGRGITVCDRWRSSFEAFLADMGTKPSPKHCIDRIDNDGPYAPENCRWATQRESMNNRRITNWVTFNGERMPLAVAAERFGVNKFTLWGRIYRRHWPHELALTIPPLSRSERDTVRRMLE